MRGGRVEAGGGVVEVSESNHNVLRSITFHVSLPFKCLLVTQLKVLT